MMLKKFYLYGFVNRKYLLGYKLFKFAVESISANRNKAENILF